MDEKQRAQSRKWHRAWEIRMREKIFSFLGNTCARCGFADRRALQIDHVNGGGTHELRGLNHNTSAYFSRILKIGRVEYQVLCANCNWIKRAENKEYGRMVAA